MAIDIETVRHASGLAGAGTRAAAAQQLAHHLGAAALFILIEDPAVDALIPAPGFPQTLPGGASWRAFLSRIRAPGEHRADLDYPKNASPVPVVAYTVTDLSIVLVGGPSRPIREAFERFAPLIPLLGGLLRAEHAARVAKGELHAAQSHARDVETLAKALDAARAETERTVLELERQTRAADEARAKAEEGTRVKDDFLAMLGHELRNPLSPILTALQLMRLKNMDSREQDVIERQVASLMRLVDDLLDVSRITRGKIELRKECVELADVAVRAIEMASPILENKQQVLHVHIAPRGLLLDVDPSRMAQVLANLLTNAAKYSDPGTAIIFAAEHDGDHIRIKVKDEGIGIGPDMLGRVFDLFVQQRQSIDRSRGGLGLGLAIVRTLVEMHGGTAAAFSRGEGHGSEFVVTVPSAAVQTDTAVPRSTQPVPVPSPTAAGARVLVVDDNEDAATLLAEALVTLGYDVRTASDGPSALRVSAGFDPVIAVLDIGLPVMDGYEVAEALRTQHGRNRPRLIAVTGYGQSGDKRRSAQAGFDAHLVKPISLEELQRALDGLPQPDS